MKILITGSNGLLGQKLIKLCVPQSEIDLVATSKGENRYPDNKGYQYYPLDVTEEGEVNSLLNKLRPDVVIHTAAMTNVDLCESEKANCDRLNVTAVENVVNACNAVGSHLVHVSTDFIFNGSHGPLSEEEEPDPLSYYGLSKWKGEQIIRQQSKSWVILRTVLVFGVVNDMSRSNIVLWAKNSLQTGKIINVVDDQYRTPTLAEDLAMGCLLAAKSKAGGVYNISGPDFMSVYELVQHVASFWNLDSTLIQRAKSSDISQPAKRPPVTGFIIDKARKELGYSPHSFTESLKLVDEQLKQMEAKI